MRRAKEAIVRVVPKYKLGINDELDEIYYKSQVMLRVPWMVEFEKLKELFNQTTWKEIFLSRVVDHCDTEDFPEDEDIFEDEDLEEDIERNPDFVASRIMPNKTTEEGLGLRSVDEAYNWTDFSSSSVDRNEAMNFHIQFRQIHSEAASNLQRPSCNLTSEQDVIIQKCLCQLSNPDYGTKRILIQGKAGTGKSTVIKALVYLISNHDRAFLSNTSPSYEVLAPTGAAAVNINGKTIHSFLKISTGTFTELKGEALRNFQLQMAPLRFLIFDEYSMIGLKLMHKIETRCREGKGNSDEPF